MAGPPAQARFGARKGWPSLAEATRLGSPLWTVVRKREAEGRYPETIRKVPGWLESERLEGHLDKPSSIGDVLKPPDFPEKNRQSFRRLHRRILRHLRFFLFRLLPFLQPQKNPLVNSYFGGCELVYRPDPVAEHGHLSQTTLPPLMHNCPASPPESVRPAAPTPCPPGTAEDGGHIFRG